MRIVNTPGEEAPGDDGEEEELGGAWGQDARPAGEGTGRGARHLWANLLHLGIYGDSDVPNRR